MAKTRKLNDNDYISVLPDDILLCILSKLKIKEQASRRWANLWTFNTTGLNIDALDFFDILELLQDKGYSQEKTLKFFSTADQILSMHRAQTLDELKIKYPAGASETLNDHLKVDGWINIAKQKQVKALYLDFGHYRENPVQLLSIGFATFSSLVTLYLEFACLSSDIVHSLLSNCKNLLKLSIISTHGNLQHLKICGSSLKLTHLELIYNDMDSLEIFAPDLVSFSYIARMVKGFPRILFKSIPQLTQLSCYRGLTCHTWRDYFVLLPQLDTLTLALLNVSDENVAMPRIPALKNLKQMHVRLMFGERGAELCLFLGLFKASLSLHRLSLDLGYYECPPLNHESTEEYAGHEFVKEVEIYNFIGSNNEVQLMIYLARSCSSLQKVIIHLGFGKIQYRMGGADYIKPENVERVVEELPSKLPQKELDILLVPFKRPNIFE